MKKIICVLASVVMMVFLAPDSEAEIFGKSYSLLTSNNPDCYSLFTLDGFELTVQGKNKLYTVEEITFANASPLQNKLTVNSDGFYTATVIAPEDFSGKLDIFIKYDGFIHRFTLYCDKEGLYFPVNTLKYKNSEVFSEIIDASLLESSAYFSCVEDEEFNSALQTQIKDLSAQITKGASTSYEKAWLLYDWLCRFMHYDHDASDGGITEETVAISSTTVTKRTVCSGYANYYCTLLEAVGIDAVTIKGSATAGGITYDTLEEGRQNHEWSAFYCTEQKRWVYVDACWGSENDYKNGMYDTADFIDARYFDPTEEAFALNHRCDTAQRRTYLADFSELYGSESQTEQSTQQTTTEAEAAQEQTTVRTEEITRDEPSATSYELPSETPDNDSTPLIITAIITSTGVIVLTIALIILKRNGKMK